MEDFHFEYRVPDGTDSHANGRDGPRGPTVTDTGEAASAPRGIPASVRECTSGADAGGVAGDGAAMSAPRSCCCSPRSRCTATS